MRNRDAIIQFHNGGDSPLRATGLPIAPATQIVNEIMQCRQLFVPRSERYSQHWSSVDMILDSQWTPEARRCPAFVAWVEQCVPWLPNRAYIARLQPRGVIEWHSDYPEEEGFSKGFILGLKCPEGSYIQFADLGKYSYADGESYHARLGIAHRVVNPTNAHRFTAFIGSSRDV